MIPNLKIYKKALKTKTKLKYYKNNENTLTFLVEIGDVGAVFEVELVF